MSYTNGVGNTQNPFAAETGAASGVEQATRTASISVAQGNEGGVSPLPATDRTKLSGLGGALAQALNESDVRMDKVSALQQAIASGTCQVSAGDVAEKMIRSLLV